jgi:hypothetical protein
VATLCTYCGTPLPGDDARYCTKCGMLVPSHPFSPKSLSSSPATTAQGSPSRTIVREQMAQQPPFRGTERTTRDVPPSWISQLDTHTLDDDKEEPELPRRGSAPVDFPLPEAVAPMQRGNIPGRPLHVKVWDDAVDTDQSSQTQMDESDGVDHDMELLPTRPLSASMPGVAPARKNTDVPPAARPARDAHVDEVEQLDTVPLATPKRAQQTLWPSVEGVSQPPPRNLFADEARASHPISPFPAVVPAAPGRPAPPRSMTSQAVSQPGVAQQIAAPPVAPLRPKRGQRKRPLAVMLVVLVILIVAGAIAFVIVKQPFSVAGVTQPQQAYSNTQLGFSVQYPRGWVAAVDSGKTTVSFSDTSHTDQFIVLTGGNASNISQYLQQEASKSGMTNEQTNLPSLAFGGASWQQLEGSILVNGASYTETLLATAHGSGFVMIMQLAPQSTYSQEEQLVFSSMRTSFQFLS